MEGIVLLDVKGEDLILHLNKTEPLFDYELFQSSHIVREPLVFQRLLM